MRAYETVTFVMDCMADPADTRKYARKSSIGRLTLIDRLMNTYRGIVDRDYRGYTRSTESKRKQRRMFRKRDRQRAKRLCQEAYNDYIDQLDFEHELWCDEVYKEEREMYYRHAFAELDDYFNRMSVDDPAMFYGSIAV